MQNIKKLLKSFYSNNKEIVEEIIKVSKNREIGYLLSNGNFGPRPSIIESESDFFSYIDKGMISYHISLERWDSPLYLGEKISKKEIEEHRIGWDLILDIDAKSIEISKIVCKEIINFLKDRNISKYYIKFSGNKGFHIAIPWEIFPKVINIEGEEKETRKLFPELARIISEYINDKIKDNVYKKIEYSFDEEYLKEIGIEDIKKSYEIDTILISSRHLVRGLYSLNEKTMSLSIPIEEKDIDKINKDLYILSEDLIIYKIVPFLTEELEQNIDRNFEKLIYSAILYKNISKNTNLKDEIKNNNLEFQEDLEVEEDVKRIKVRFKGKIPEELYPPCIKEILNNKAIEDGRKRAVFILINFLYNLGVSWEEIERKIREWNNNLENPLRERYIEYQLDWHKKIYKNNKGYLTPNCNNETYYKDMGICKPDQYCKLIKNPLSYPYKRLKEERKNSDTTNK